LPPAGWTVWSRSVPSPQATSSPSPPTSTTGSGCGRPAGRDRGTPDLHGIGAEAGEGARRRVEGADAPKERYRGLLPVELRIRACDLARIRHALQRLGRCRERAVGFEPAQRAYDRRRPHLREPFGERTRGVPGIDRGFDPIDHRPGVEARIHLHDRDPGRRVTGQQGMLDRRGAAPARKQRSVDVESPVSRPSQDRRRQDEPICGHHQHVEIDRERVPAAFLRPQRGGLQNGQSVPACKDLDRRGLDRKAAAARPIGLGENHGHGKARLEHGVERLGGERGGPGKADPETRHRRREAVSPRAAASCAAWRSAGRA
jgi:hypothetical protein